MEAHSAVLSTSGVTATEIDDGIAILRREGATRKNGAFTEWCDRVPHLHGDRVLPFDATTARIAGALA
jgi:hypothetical protein